LTLGGVLLRFVTALAAALLSGAAAAQDYPSRAITLVVPFAVGSGIDPTARIIGDALSRALKQPVVLDHKPGANGAIAASAVARAAPDGYTIFMTTVSTHSANPNLLKSIPYDPGRDFAALSRFGNLPFMLVIDPKIGATSVPEFIAYVQAILASSATPARMQSVWSRARRSSEWPTSISCTCRTEVLRKPSTM
jgi:tripartite-type tricarboxylate transporter receptor subunit TctC